MTNGKISQIGLIIAFMKFTAQQVAIAILISALAHASSIRGQEILNQKVSLMVSNETTKSLLKKIEKQVSVKFTYNSEVLPKGRVSILRDSITVGEVLNQIFGSTVSFEIVDNLVVIVPSSNIGNVPTDAQGITDITGRVIDEENNPLPGVNILEKGTTNGTTTDSNGAYTISVANPNAVLVFSFIGYTTQEFSVSGRTSLDVTMQPDLKTLQEVVVVGYGSKNKNELTGAVQQVKADDMKDIPVSQLTQKLQGRLAGVQINQATGRPGQALNIRIRGAASLSTSSSPLYVVDGFPITGDINNINPNEIETVTVLKDAASASLYGSRAAFGVVLITTKAAKEGETNISLDAYTGFQEVPQKGRPDMMNGTEWAQFKKEYYEDLGQAVPEAFQNPEQYGEGYDWYDAMLQTGKISDLSLTVNSSKEKFSTSIVAGYFNQEGVLLNSDYTRFSLRANSKFKLGKKVILGVNVAPTYNYGNSPTSDGQFFSSGGLLLNATLTPPILAYQNEDGTYPTTVTTPGVTTFPTPNWVRSIKDITNKTTDSRLLSNGYIEYEPISGLKLKSSINIDMWQTLVHYFQPSTAGRAFAAAPSPLNANLSETNRQYRSWLSENTVEYSKKIEDHDFQILVGYTTQKYRFDGNTISGSNFSDDRVQTINAALVKNNPTMDIQEWSLLSYLARINYNFKSKYLLSASIRRDGSSRFGANNRWGNFPAVSAGWVASEESFLKDVAPLSFLKIRASYGLTGNNNLGNYTQYSAVAGGINVPFNNVTSSGIAVTTLGNDDLGWESTREFDIGLDFGLFEDRVSVTYDFYNKRTTDLLYTLTVPGESGFTNITGNVGEIKFWGHEVNVSTNNLVGKFKWNTNFNIAFTDNKVLALSSLTDSLFVGQGLVTTLTRVGGRIGQFYGLIHDGVYVNQSDFDSSPKIVDSQVGTIKFRDVNGDGQITLGNTGGDKTVIGNPFPKFIFGFTNNFYFQNFDLSIVTVGSYGNKIASVTEQGATNLDGVFNLLKEVKDRWRSPENPGAGRYGKTTGSTGHDRDDFHTRYVKDGSYISIKNITLGYTPKFDSRFISTLRFYASVQQAFVFTNYRYGNPEVGVDFNGNLPGSTSQGIDYSAYPVPRTFTFGLNVNLK